MSRRVEGLLLGGLSRKSGRGVARGVTNDASEVPLATLYVGTRLRTGGMIAVIKSSELGEKIGVERCKKQWSGFGVCGAGPGAFYLNSTNFYTVGEREV